MGPVVKWSSGKMVKWSSGKVVQGSSGPVVKWSSGKVVQWTSGPVDQWSKKCLQKVLFNSIKREARYHEFKLDVHGQTKKERNRPGPRGGPTRGGPPKKGVLSMFKMILSFRL